MHSLKKIKKALCNAKIYNIRINLNTLKADPTDKNDGNNNVASKAEDFTIKDTIGKSLTPVKQVSII